VIEEEFRAAKVTRPGIMIGGWALPPAMVYGTQEQQERWIPPTLRGEISWCQLFSEPGAGSDLANLSTRATRTDGGYLISGQKVWTSMAQFADWGILLARTDPDAPKHNGI
jgi:alkylation response protein AidB-like acyl-CoA dehydrogenase